MTNTKSINLTLILAGAVFLLIGYNLIEAWTAPAGNPPDNNVPAPINIGTGSQTKDGPLGVDSLALFATSPRIQFVDADPGQRDAWIHLDNNNLNFLANRFGDTGSWSGSQPWPLVLHMDATSTNDYALFSNQIRATEYCDRSGNNCLKSDSSGKSIELGYINVESSDDILVANTKCVEAGYDGIWAGIDRSGTENLICFKSDAYSSSQCQKIDSYLNGGFRESKFFPPSTNITHLILDSSVANYVVWPFDIVVYSTDVGGDTDGWGATIGSTSGTPGVVAVSGNRYTANIIGKDSFTFSAPGQNGTTMRMDYTRSVACPLGVFNL